MKVIEGMIVYNVEKVKTAVQNGIDRPAAVVKTYDQLAYKTVLTHDPVADTITAEYKDYQDNLRSDFNGDIIFEFEGEQIVMPALSGVATIDFDILEPGTYVVKTAMPEVANGEVTINV